MVTRKGDGSLRGETATSKKKNQRGNCCLSSGWKKDTYSNPLFGSTFLNAASESYPAKACVTSSSTEGKPKLITTSSESVIHQQNQAGPLPFWGGVPYFSPPFGVATRRERSL